MSAELSQLNELHWLMEMLHNVDIGLVVLDRNYKVQLFNGFMENHSGLLPGQVKNEVLFDLFSEIPKDWFIRKAESVFLLKNKAFTIWEQRPYLFKFANVVFYFSGTPGEFAPCFSEMVPHDPSLEEMRMVVVEAKRRPRLKKEWEIHPVGILLFYDLEYAIC